MEFNIKINNKPYVISKSTNILQVCNNKDYDIPRFCFHESLSIAGNCRMCLVEVQGVVKPVASCAMPINNNISIFTNSKLVKKAREGILEFILLNHPLDCPICDQGGECDLQDQSLIYGNDKGRFYDFKRAVSDKNLGFLIKTLMTRCIQCTRCIRYMDEVAGIKNLGTIGRGSSMEISNFLEKINISEVSGNIIDLCPVGALTSKPYSFIARSWELNKFNSFDINDLLCPSIRLDVRDNKILRILPRFNNLLNDYWISDLTRFNFDSYLNKRILSPFFFNKDVKQNLNWLDILNMFFVKKIQRNVKINVIIGDFIDLNSLYFLKNWKNFSNLNVLSSTIKSDYCINDFRENFIFQHFSDLDRYNNIIFVGVNLRFTNPLFNIKIKKWKQKTKNKLFFFGSEHSFSNIYNYSISNILSDFVNFLTGRSVMNLLFLKSTKTLICFNYYFLQTYFKLSINTLNLFFQKLNLINKVDICVIPGKNDDILVNDINLINSVNLFEDFTFNFSNLKHLNKKKHLNFCLNTNSTEISFTNDNNDVFYLGTHVNSSFINNSTKLNNNCWVLPISTHLENNNWFVNFFGLLQKTSMIIFPSKAIRSNFQILNYCFRFLNFKNIYWNYNFIKIFIFGKLFKNYHHYNMLKGNETLLNVLNYFFIANKTNFKSLIGNVSIFSYITNFYFSTYYGQNSLVLQKSHNSMRSVYTNFF
jgi:NADH-quinone oxidoreductase subunit G